MKQAYIYFPGFSYDQIFECVGREDGQAEFFVQLKAEFRRHGVNLVTNPVSESESSINVYFDPSRDPVGKNTVIVLWEHEGIYGKKSLKYLKKFALVLTWNDRYLNNDLPCHFFRLPLPGYSTLKSGLSPTTRQGICAVFSNKFSPRFTFSELYSVRITLLKRFYKAKIPVDLYGMGWESPPKAILPFGGWPTKILLKLGLLGTQKLWIDKFYRGSVLTKRDVLISYRFCLVVENYKAPHYITEKIFDAMVAGCIPIYIGAPNICSLVPSSCFINANGFDNFSKLIDYLKLLSPEEISRYQSNISTYIGSEEFSSLLPKTSANYFVTKVMNSFGCT